MFYLSKNEELTNELLYKMINRFAVEHEPRLRKYKNYYDGIQAILRKRYADLSKPCNRTIINYCKNIVDSYCGYLATPEHISYRSENDIEEVMNILRYNDYQAQDSDFLENALIYGVAYELMYIDADSKVRFKLIDPLSCFGVYDDTLSGDLLYFVRMYKVSEWDESDLYNVDVYTDTEIRHYTMNGRNGNLQARAEAEPHYFAQCPANIFTLPDSKSIFDCILTLQDSINDIISSEIDDFNAFCDAYLLISGADMDTDEASVMRENRVLILPQGATAQWLTKAVNDTQVENIIKRLHNSIYRIAQCPDFSSESFVAGVSSGIAIQYRLTGMETRAGKIEGLMKKALQRRIEIICGIVSLQLGEEVFRDIQIDFKRNIPADITATIQIINSLKGIVSDATLLSQLDFVTDVNAELEAVEEQKQRNMELYSFGTSADNDEDNEE